jgi:hypothetical protein
MALINHDITLLIAEHTDMASLPALMLASKTFYQLITAHERSIVKTKMAKLAHDPILRPPLGALLSSAAPRQPGLGRNVLEPESFAVAKELEARERRIDRIFDSRSTMEAINRVFPFRHLPANQKGRLVDGLKDACRVADSIGDRAAVHARLEQERPGAETGRLSDGGRAIEYGIHLARQQHIRSLPPIRLAFLTLLASLAGMQYAQQRQSPLDSDPFRWERIAAFKETLLRHGTVVMCALLSLADDADDQSESVRYYTSQVDRVLRELLEYEAWGDLAPDGLDGDARPIPDGLHMTMVQAFPVPEEGEDAEEEDQPQEDVDEEEDADGNWLFNINVFDDDDVDDADSNPSTMSPPLDPRAALILEWIQEPRHNPVAKVSLRTDFLDRTRNK